MQISTRTSIFLFCGLLSAACVSATAVAANERPQVPAIDGQSETALSLAAQALPLSDAAEIVTDAEVLKTAGADTSTTKKLRYTPSVRRSLHRHNKAGQKTGDIKLYAKEGYWGPAVKIQSCYGDNILTRFSVADAGGAKNLWFQYMDTTYRNRRRHHWVMVNPGMDIPGRHIFVRAQSWDGNAIVSLKVVGNCISSKPGSK